MLIKPTTDGYLQILHKKADSCLRDYEFAENYDLRESQILFWRIVREIRSRLKPHGTIALCDEADFGMLRIPVLQVRVSHDCAQIPMRSIVRILFFIASVSDAMICNPSGVSFGRFIPATDIKDSFTG